MKTVVSIIFGFLSGILLYFMAAVIAMDPTSEPASATILMAVFFLGGGAASAWAIRRDARSLSKVFSRGFLFGAAEWLAMIGVGVIAAGKAAASSSAMATGSDAAAAGAIIGGGLFSLLSGGFSIFMALLCLTGFAVSHSIGREMAPESKPMHHKTCPECAEIIQAAAKRCRHCGHNLTPRILHAKTPETT